MHLAGSGRVIIQLSDVLSEGVILCDDKGTKVAKVMELIGPVKRPFVRSGYIVLPKGSSKTNILNKISQKLVLKRAKQTK